MYRIALVCVIIIVLSIFFLYRKNKQREKENYQLERKSRDNKLDQQLSNPFDSGKRGTYSPYQIEYTEVEEKNEGKTVSLFQITEKTDRAIRKYLFKQEDTVYIGRQNGDLAILKAEAEGECCCKINFKQNLYCIKTLGAERIVIKRGTAETSVSGKGIVLNNKDKICFSEVEYIFEIIR